jgi:hypothetical protein
MSTRVQWHRRLDSSEIPSDRMTEAERILATSARDLGLESLKIQWYVLDDSQGEHAHLADPQHYFYDEAIRMSHGGSTIYLRRDWDLGTIRYEIAFRAAAMAQDKGQQINPVAYARGAGDRPRTVAREAFLRSDRPTPEAK